TYLGFKTVPTGFIPTQDQGYLIVNLAMPDAASIYRSDAVIRQMTQIAVNTPGVAHVVALPGFSVLTGVNQSNAGTMFCALKPFEERAGHDDLSAAAITEKLVGQYRQLDDGFALVFPPPPVRGIGSAGGFRTQIEDR